MMTEAHIGLMAVFLAVLAGFLCGCLEYAYKKWKTDRRSEDGKI